mmetsp:Transcript_29083/g.86116  ORF Transcript_29083/g.86116 Transcript_29083/m.86116 type:complete len:329 (-) Transcript_29083:176-1162(-)
MCTTATRPTCTRPSASCLAAWSRSSSIRSTSSTTSRACSCRARFGCTRHARTNMCCSSSRRSWRSWSGRLPRAAACRPHGSASRSSSWTGPVAATCSNSCTTTAECCLSRAPSTLWCCQCSSACATCITWASCTATSSRRTCCLTTACRSRWPTLVSRSTSTPSAQTHARARSTTWRPKCSCAPQRLRLPTSSSSRSRGSTPSASTPGPSAPSFTSCSPARHRSARPRCARRRRRLSRATSFSPMGCPTRPRTLSVRACASTRAIGRRYMSCWSTRCCSRCSARRSSWLPRAAPPTLSTSSACRSTRSGVQRSACASASARMAGCAAP